MISLGKALAPARLGQGDEFFNDPGDFERGQDIAILPSASVVVEEFSKFLTGHAAGTLVDWQRGRIASGGRADALIRKWQAARSTSVETRRAFRDLFGELGADPMDVLKRDDNALVRRDIDASNTSHVRSPLVSRVHPCRS